ncbi:MAG: sodium:alanine symporter family protein [Clostridiales bacterium]|jgi:AGCS family alanine or glycine:cation symporter|nr:sodium:alanine symporter family protein [Clostridiales bacterium]
MLSILSSLNHFIWGIPMPILLFGVHIYFTLHLKGVQKHIGKAIGLSLKPDTSGEGDISGFATLAATLAATIGTGNIVGISTAVALGGPGAIFWCWLTGLLGMATSYAECFLGVLYRRKTEDGTYIGGPMYAIEYGMDKKWLAVLFCFFTLIASYGVGCSTQARAITETAKTLWGLPEYIVGILIAIVVGLVIVGGIKSIGSICTRLVPAMGFFYLFACIVILILNHDYLLLAFRTILKSAFLPSKLPAAVAGGFIGGGLKIAARYGIARGLFTNEAGLGSAAIAAAGAKTSHPSRQALISMSATFWDTVVMCAITGLVIVTNLLKNPSSVEGYSFAELTTAAFAPIPFGRTILGISLIAFAIATLIGWSYFGEKAVEYLFGKSGINTYRLCYIVMIFVGSVMSLKLVWELTDFVNAFMALPNLICLLALRNKIIPYK